MRNAQAGVSAFFFVCGCAAFASIPYLQKVEFEKFQRTEPYFSCPVPLFSRVAMIRRDASGKGDFGASRGNRNERTHQGVDLLVKVGNPITASKSGRVSYAGIGKGYGWYAELVHPDGRLSRYAHLSTVEVSQGQWVASGSRIGTAGKSGNADDPRMLPHLHFEIRENGKPVNPLGGLMDPTLPVR